MDEPPHHRPCCASRRDFPVGRHGSAMADPEAERGRHGRSAVVGAGAASGLVAGIAMGLVLQLGTDLLPLFGAFAGGTSILRGWLVHLTMSVLYGVVFAAIVAVPAVERLLAPEGYYEYAFAGVVYAAMAMGAGVGGTIALLPFVLELPWVTARGGRVPGPALVGLVPAVVFGVGHLVYGVVLGAVYAFLRGPPS